MKSNAIVYTSGDGPGDRNFFSKIEPDASEPMLAKGGYLEIDPDAEPKAGDIVIAAHGDNLAKMRRLVIEDGQRYLLPLAANDPCPGVIAERELRVYGIVRSITMNLLSPVN